MRVMLVAMLSVGLFMAAFWVAKVVPVARGAIAVVNGAFASMRNPDVTDEARERLMRAGSLTLIKSFAEIALRSAAALAVAIVPVFFSDWIGFAPQEAVFAFLARPDVIAGVTGVAIAGYLLYARLWRNR